MSNIQSILFLFILLVVIVSSGFFFSSVDFSFTEGFRSSSLTERGEGIGDSFAAPLDLPLNTDNTTVFNNTYSVNENGLDDEPTFYGFPRRRT
jgi:hypothetical protein